MRSDTSGNYEYGDIIAETARVYVRDRHPELAEDLERYVATLSLDAEDMIASSRVNSFNFDTELLQAGAAIVYGIIASFLTDILKKLRKNPKQPQSEKPQKLSKTELKNTLCDIETIAVKRFKRRTVKQIGHEDLVEEIVDYSIVYWRQDK